MGFDDDVWVRLNSRAWRLLRADNAPLVLRFLHLVFVENNVRAIRRRISRAASTTSCTP
jgi:hypothetical protein